MGGADGGGGAGSCREGSSSNYEPSVESPQNPNSKHHNKKRPENYRILKGGGSKRGI